MPEKNVNLNSGIKFMKKFILHFIFVLIVVGDLLGEFLQNPFIDHIFKPLIMVWIGSYFFLHSKNLDKKVIQLAFFAFVFSWIGDLFMMFASQFLFFVVGISAFLIAQIFYSFLFLRTINLSGKKPYLKKTPYWFLAYLAYGIIMYILLFPQLDYVLKVAVFIYVVAILTMSAMALNRYGNGHPISFSMVFLGSLLFVASDSMIAINRFLIEIPFEGLWIMLTYISAQYLVMRGILMQYE